MKILVEKPYTMKSLASGTVTVLGCQWLVSLQLVLYFSAVTLAVPDRIEVLAFVNSVRRSLLPLVFFAMGGISALELMRVSISIRLILRFGMVLGHGGSYD